MQIIGNSFGAFLLLLFSTAYSQNRKEDWPIPPNCVQLYDSLFIDQAEVTNLRYLEFLNSVRRDSGYSYYESMLPDTTVWDEYDHSGKTKWFYLRNPNLIYYPVVGVSYDQARAFSVWRSQTTTFVVNQIDTTSHVKVKFRFRLPREDEWIFAASSGLDTTVYFYGFKDFEIKPTLIPDPQFYKDRMKKDVENLSDFDDMFHRFRRFGREPFFNCLKKFFNYFEYGAMQPLSTIDLSNNAGMLKEKFPYNNLSKANAFGISGMIGNVAEMTTTKGIAKGGSWAHELQNCKISKRIKYYKPSAWLGFRCVCVVSREH